LRHPLHLFRLHLNARSDGGIVSSQNRRFNYASMLQSGVTYHKGLKIPAKAVELKLLVGNLVSGKIGTLTIPLSAIDPGAAIEK
jgi:hypothetical protein